MGAVVSTCSPRSSPCLWLPWLLARLLCLLPLATFPDLSLGLLLLLPGGLHRLPTLASLLTMWARGKLLYLSLQETSPDLSLLSCCRCLVDCTDCSPRTACSPCGQEASCSPPDPWQYSRTCPWVSCCCLVDCPDRSPWPACS